MDRHLIPLSKKDLEYINSNYNPKVFDNILSSAILLFVVLPFAPFYSRHGMGRPLIKSMGYGYALLLCFFLFLLIIAVAYLLHKKDLRKDLKSDSKTLIIAQLKRKDWVNEKKFKLFFDDEILDKLQITISKEDFYKCFKGDLIKIEYLTYSKHLLNYEVIPKTS